VVSHFLNSRCVDYWNAIIHILKYIKGSPGKKAYYMVIITIVKLHVIQMLIRQDVCLDRKFTFGYNVLIGDNLISWKK